MIPKISDKFFFNLLLFSIIGLTVLTLIAPFVEIPYLDKTLEKFGKDHPYITGGGTIIFGSWLFHDNFRNGRSEKWTRRKEYLTAIFLIGVGLYHIIKEMI